MERILAVVESCRDSPWEVLASIDPIAILGVVVAAKDLARGSRNLQDGMTEPIDVEKVAEEIVLDNLHTRSLDRSVGLPSVRS